MEELQLGQCIIYLAWHPVYTNIKMCPSRNEKKIVLSFQNFVAMMNLPNKLTSDSKNNKQIKK